MSEAEIRNDLSAGDPLRQGDVIRWERPDGTVWTEYCIVVTADCDLANNKTRGRISYVPAVTFESYIAGIWGPDYVDKKVAKILEGAFSAMQRAHSERNAGARLSETALLEWIKRDDPSAIVAALMENAAEHVEHPILASVMGAVLDEVVGPDMIALLRAQPNARSVGQPESTALGLLR
jgi:hypothetical protein